jgi:hypothetical protein
MSAQLVWSRSSIDSPYPADPVLPNQNLRALSIRSGGMLDHCAVSSQIHLQHNMVVIEAPANLDEIGGCGFG